jgi:hypothetical protein
VGYFHNSWFSMGLYCLVKRVELIYPNKRSVSVEFCKMSCNVLCVLHCVERKVNTRAYAQVRHSIHVTTKRYMCVTNCYMYVP